jgi:hypothetical protein
MTLKIQLKCAWSRAKTNDAGIIVGWSDYTKGDIVEVTEPIPLAITEYERIEEKQESNNTEEKQETNKPSYSQRGRHKKQP